MFNPLDSEQLSKFRKEIKVSPEEVKRTMNMLLSNKHGRGACIPPYAALLGRGATTKNESSRENGNSYPARRLQYNNDMTSILGPPSPSNPSNESEYNILLNQHQAN